MISRLQPCVTCRRRYSVFIFFALLFICGFSIGQDIEGETGKLNRWLDEQYEEELGFSPIGLSKLGRKELYDQIDDFSEDGQRKELAWREQNLEKMQQFDYDALTSDGKISYDFWKYRQEVALAARPFINHWYRLQQMNGAHIELPYLLINLHRVDSEKDMVDLISRTRETGRAIRQLLKRTRQAEKQGIRLPYFAFELVQQQAQGVITGEPFEADAGSDSALWANYKSKVESLRERALVSQERAQELLDEARAALMSSVLPAYRDLINWAESSLIAASTEAHGAYSLPDGKNYYKHMLGYFTTTDYTAETVHQIGLDEVARIRAEMDDIRDEVGFDGSLDQFLVYVRDDDRFFYSDDDAGRQAYIAATERVLDNMHERLPSYFGVLPKASLVVKRAEPYVEVAGGAAFYKNSTPDGSRPGVYYLHLVDMSTQNITDLETTAYHEGVPGHHLQVALALERKGVPTFQTSAWYSAYGEGWALYAERLAKEMGFFASPFNDFGRLVMEMLRAVRLVVDTGIHAKGWTEEQAVSYMLENTSISEATARSETRRYFVWPGQATSYKIGMLRILQLREQAENALGERFDIREFHDVALGSGALPLPILENRINGWIESESTAAMDSWRD